MHKIISHYSINLKSIFIGLVSLFAISYSMGQSIVIDEMKTEDIEVSATLSGMAFITTDLEGSIKFYTEFLNFKEYKRIVIESEAGLAPFGVSGDKKLNYVALIPKVWSKESPNFPGLNFIEILDSEKSSLKQDAKRYPIAGEIMKAYSVKGLVEIEKRMRAAGVTIITPLTPSATGKSMTLCVIDPNGVRIQMYEYIKKK